MKLKRSAKRLSVRKVSRQEAKDALENPSSNTSVGFKNPKLRVAVKEASILQSLIREAERRHLGAKVERYRPHKKQEEFHYNPAKYRLLTWGNQTGKTVAGVAECIAYALGYRPWNDSKTRTCPSKIMCAGIDFVHAISGDVWPRFQELIPTGAIESLEKIHSGIVSKINFKNGSFIAFMSYEQDASKYEGYTWDFVMFNEPPPRDVWIATSRGLMARNGRAIFCMTPLSEPWIYDEIYAKCGGTDPDYWQSSATMFENPYVPLEQKQKYIEQMNPEEREARVFGKFKHLMGRIFPEFDTGIHLMEVSV